MISKSAFILLLATLAVTACSATARLYPGEPRLPSEVATILPGYHHDVSINRVDGVHTFWQRIEVTEGHHTIEGSCMPDPDDDDCPVGDVSAYLEAGKTYVLEASTIGIANDCEFIIHDAAYYQPPTNPLFEMLTNR